jgi:hypothetical protein
VVIFKHIFVFGNGDRLAEIITLHYFTAETQQHIRLFIIWDFAAEINKSVQLSDKKDILS